MSGDATVQRNLDTETPLRQQLEDFYKLVDEIKVCMMTTKCPDGNLSSRPMKLRGRTGTDLWFVSNQQSQKMCELQTDPHVNVAFYKPSTDEWVSVSGAAQCVQNKELCEKLWDRDMKAWFGDLGDGIHTGEVHDPRVCIIHVKAHTAHYYIQDTPSVYLEFAKLKSVVTGEPAVVGKMRHLGEEQIEVARKLEE